MLTTDENRVLKIAHEEFIYSLDSIITEDQLSGLHAYILSVYSWPSLIH